MASTRDVNGTASNGKNTVSWSHDQDLKLLQKVESHLLSFEAEKQVFPKDLKWREIAFDDFDEHEVKKHWATITSGVRKIRNAREILEDTKIKIEHGKRTRKRKKDAHDPSIPLKPKSAFFLFMEKKKPRLAAKHPSMSILEIATKVGKKWRELSEDEREKYKAIYRENKEQYDCDLAQYFLDNNPGETPPKTAFELWSKGKAKELKASRPDISEKKLNKKLKKYWESLEDKEDWERKAKKETEKFLKRVRAMVQRDKV
ncbi:high mobility group B protein 6-like [Acropora millepora]|uniref:high mobility group B protein 6-like n=1 Tax=Acropora millepora TaxID=45264 RepID=UPI001CF5A408|nr:high mobility group B protein 6-like [Acropora millepora]